MVDATQKLPVAARPPSTWRTIRTSKGWQRALRHSLSYVVLFLGTLFMLFPLLWMITSSFKPQWQIFSNPIQWIPQEWDALQAGTTNRMISLWRVTVDGETREVIDIGTRRYTTVIDPALLTNLRSIPPDQLGEAVATEIEGVVLNVRPWTVDGETRQAVALARDGDNLLSVAVDDLLPAVSRLPLDEVNSGERTNITVGEAEFRGRTVTTEAGTREIIPIGPESELRIVAPPEVLERATLVPTGALVEAGFAEVGQTELRLSRIGDDPAPYVTLVAEQWQPVIDEAELEAAAFIAPRAAMGERQASAVNGAEMQVARYTPEEGEPFDVAILVSGTARSLVIPVDTAATLRLAPAGSLITGARGDTYDGIAFRVQDGFIEGETTSAVALVGDARDMALVVPLDAVTDAFDVNPSAMERALYPALRLDGYREALATRVGDVYFPTFFRNSFVLVLLNTIGHVLSCIVVAYAFARLRAPGKNFLFLVLLGTMMLPFPVTLVPVYEIFRDLGMINTLFPLFLRSFFGNAFLIFMLRQFFASIPRELEEAARIDGASTLRIIWDVFVPLSKPAIATVIIFTFWWTWNSFFEPFVFLSSPELFPVSVGLNFFKDQFGQVYYDRLMAASIMSMVPMLVLFFFAQRYFIEGIQLTGMKG